MWAHNSHIGDARGTEMGLVRGEINIGQLCRERFGQEAALIGFGTDRGTVAAATDWDGPMEIKRVRPVASRQLRAALPRQRRRPVPARPAGSDDRRAAPRLAVPAPGAGYRRHLPAGDGAGQPLFRRLAAAAVRRLCLVRRDQRGDAAADRRSATACRKPIRSGFERMKFGATATFVGFADAVQAASTLPVACLPRSVAIS